jgi:hypothetical protein
LFKKGYTDIEITITSDEINILNPLESLQSSQKSSQRQIEEEDDEEEEIQFEI